MNKLKSLKFFILFIFLILFIKNVFCQVDNKKWNELNFQHNSGKINDTSYFNQAQLLVEKYFKDPEIKEKLTKFKDIAWSKQSYSSYRVKYYAYLSNNANYLHKDGVAIYYLEKLEEELKKTTPYTPSLNRPRLLLSIYSDYKSEEKMRIAQLDSVIPFLNVLPEIIITGNVQPITCLNAMTILLNGTKLYSDKGDINKVNVFVSFAEDLWSSLQKKNVLDEGKMLQVLYQLYQIKYHSTKLKNDFVKAKAILDTAYGIIHSESNVKMNTLWKQVAQKTLLLKYIDLFNSEKKYDSAKLYLQKLKDLQDADKAGPENRIAYLLNYGKLKANTNDYKDAYENILLAYERNDSIIGSRLLDINNNMYASTLAENTKDQLLISEKQKQKSNNIIVIICLLSVSCIALLYLKIKRKEQEIKTRIHDLNTASELQIAELEEQNRNIKIEEQKRLGMQLHDDVAGNVAYLKTKIETEILNADNDALKERLKQLSSNISALYEKTRDKSHTLFNASDIEAELSFKKRVQLLLDNGLQGDKYKKEIVIDTNALKDITLKTKIEMLYIIQEAITNILKHAKAHNVSILIYQDIAGLILQITDDGVGFDINNKKKGIGIKSIKDRVLALAGKVDIESVSDKGTSINICLPAA